MQFRFSDFILRHSAQNHNKTRIESTAFDFCLEEPEFLFVAEAYQNALKHGQQPSYRARINIIGHSGAGKTTLTKRLLGEAFSTDFGSTNGIETHRVEVDLTNDTFWSQISCSDKALQKEKLAEIAASVQARTPQQTTEFKQSPEQQSALTSHCPEGAKRQEDIREKQPIQKEVVWDQLQGGKEREGIGKEVSSQLNKDQDTFQYKSHQVSDRVQKEKEDVRMKEPSKKEISRDQLKGGKQGKGTVREDISQVTTREVSSQLNKDQDKSHQVSDRMAAVQSGVLQALKDRGETKEKPTGIVQLWDFGGQSEFYTTHHLFLDANAINIIVMDISKGLKDPIADSSPAGSKVGMPTSQEDMLCYWLRNIQMKAEIQGQQLNNVVLILTHTDMIPAEDIADFRRSLLCTIQDNILPTIPQNKIFVVDSQEEKENFGNIQECLFQMIKEQKVGVMYQKDTNSWGAPRPVRWLNLEADIYRTQSVTGAKYLQLEDVMKLAKVYHMNEAEVQSFLQFQHTMGDFVYFSDEGLKETVITHPQWLIDSLKVIITPESFLKKASSRDIAEMLLKGRVDHNALDQIWLNTDVHFLMELLQKFDLVVDMNSVVGQPQHFLVPSMLPHKNH